MQSRSPKSATSCVRKAAPPALLRVRADPPDMFSIPRLKVIESEEGFSVEVLGRTAISNREGDKVLFVDSEAPAPRKGIAISTDSIQAWNLPHNEPIPLEKRRRSSQYQGGDRVPETT